MGKEWKRNYTARQNRNSPDNGGKSGKGKLRVLGISLLCSYLVTAVLILVLAFLLYKFGLSEKAVRIGIIIVYVAGTFIGGYLAGRKLQNRKFLWGFLLGMLYFAGLLLISSLVNIPDSAQGSSLLSTLIICAAGGTMGGMAG